MKENIIEKKSFEFALKTIELYKKIISQNEYVLSKQLSKSEQEYILSNELEEVTIV